MNTGLITDITKIKQAAEDRHQEVLNMIEVTSDASSDGASMVRESIVAGYRTNSGFAKDEQILFCFSHQV